MSLSDFLDSVGNKLKEKIENFKAISIFVRERSKFEGWLKIEVVDTLLDLGIPKERITPEENRTDIVFELEGKKVGMELKTINTNYIHELVKNKTRPITKNIEGILDDINKLKRNTEFHERVIVFVVFPLSEKNEKFWRKHIEKIKKHCKKLKEWEINFKMDFEEKVPGWLYIGELY